MHLQHTRPCGFFPRLIAVVTCATFATLTPSLVQAGYLLETAQVGAGGQSSGTSLLFNQFLGARFHLDQPAVIDAVGGHLFGQGTLFAAIAAIDGPLGFPIGAPSSFVPLAVTTFVPPAPFASADVSVPLSVVLPSGDYAVMFGTGRFGATGDGAMPSNNLGPPPPAFFTDEFDRWREPLGLTYRFTVSGMLVPEPSSIVLLLSGFCAACLWHRRRTK